jgi:hypothetical protein
MMSPVSAESIPIVFCNASTSSQNRWNKVYDLLPAYFSIRPVWDGMYMYYACFCNEEGKDFWVVIEQMKFNHHGVAPIKSGEIVYPTHWMEIFPPLD